MVAINVYAESMCGAKYITDPNSKWTGECVNGQAHGIGLLSFTYNNEAQETFGRFNNGNWTGLHLYTSGIYKFVKHYNNSLENIIGPTVVTKGLGLMLLPNLTQTIISQSSVMKRRLVILKLIAQKK